MRAFSLRTRLTLTLAALVFVVFGSAAKLVDWRADSEMQQRFDASLLARAQALASLVQMGTEGVEVDAEDAAAAVFPGNALANWYELRCGGRVVARTAVVPSGSPARRTPAFTDSRVGVRTLRTVTLRFRPRSDDSGQIASSAPVCTLRYALDRGPLDDILGTLDLILLGSLFGACVLVMLLTPLLVNRGLRPLAVLNRAMATIGPDAPGRRLPPSDTAELKPLVAVFNEVLARMDAGLARERQFASGLAHEFRTRLAELRALVDVESRFPSGRAAREVLADVGTIGAELEATVTALLRLTRLQSGLEEMHAEATLLAPLLERVCARHAATAKVRGVAIVQHRAADCVTSLVADAVLLEVVLDNLLGNAVAYAPTGTAVELACAGRSVCVSNAAPTLRAEDLANFGQRFWRNGEPGAGHAGLGLALAGAAARALDMQLGFALEAGVLHARLCLIGALAAPARPHPKRD